MVLFSALLVTDKKYNIFKQKKNFALKSKGQYERMEEKKRRKGRGGMKNK